MYQFDCAVCSDVGVMRKSNEDNFYLNGIWKTEPAKLRCTRTVKAQDELLCAVCDGMGGEEFGELASLTAVEQLDRYTPSQFPNHMDCYVREAGEAICQAGERLGARNMGSTLACLSISDGIATAFNLGDSRIYHSRAGQLTCLSQDHTNARRLLAAGLPCTSRDYSTLTQFLGVPGEEMRLEPFVFEPISIAARDRFLLCSDGFSGALEEEEIGRLLCSHLSSEKLASLCVQTALEQGSLDNVTVAVITVVLGRQGRNKVFARLFQKAAGSRGRAPGGE